jgi:hypothetical protein
MVEQTKVIIVVSGCVVDEQPCYNNNNNKNSNSSPACRLFVEEGSGSLRFVQFQTTTDLFLTCLIHLHANILYRLEIFQSDVVIIKLLSKGMQITVNLFRGSRRILPYCASLPSSWCRGPTELDSVLENMTLCRRWSVQKPWRKTVVFSGSGRSWW